MNKYVYLFSEGNASMKDILGGKGANLAEMTSIGLRVPQGMTISTQACIRFYNEKETIWNELKDEIINNLEKLEHLTGKKFAGKENPLLVSVRSGAKVSMPGMMDTILNLGLNDETVVTIAKMTGNYRFAYDSYRRFIQMFSDVVLNIHKELFEEQLEHMKTKNGLTFDTELTAEHLEELVKIFKEIVKKENKQDFPQDPYKQLMLAIEAVFRSWNNNRAITYRNLYDIPHDIGTAVNVQSMVFGNMGDDSGTGVAFTRNPATGENKLFGEFLINAQGEDVVAGIRTPQTIEELGKIMPDIYKQFTDGCDTLENHYKDMQDIEFTIEKGKLYFLQTRSGKRTAAAALRAAVEMQKEGLITKEQAVMRLEPSRIDQLLHPTFDIEELKKAKELAKGLAASPGAVQGRVYFNADDAVKAAKDGNKVILVRKETSPEDIEGMTISEGILTSRGGMTSHAAVVARGMGTCCVAGCESISVYEKQKYFTAGSETVKEGEYISLDGSTGKVYLGRIKTVNPSVSGDFAVLMGWADELRQLKVRTNADTPRDAQAAVEFGAEGIGLCRTEHMFFDEKRIPAVRRMIVADNVEERESALAEILPMQKNDFKEIFKVMQHRPVTIRLLDPPLHEFLPHSQEDIDELAKSMNISSDILTDKVNSLQEFNPMLGHRGCRLAVTYPEIAVMQTRAIIEAAVEVVKEEKYDVVPEIMIPLIGVFEELTYIKDIIIKTADKIIASSGVDMKYLVGTMIEIPRAALLSDDIATEAEFFSFGTNDLTQMTYGFSRDDAGKFINDYIQKGIFDKDPFTTIDQKGVGKLMEMSVKLGRSTRPDLKVGICGEHGGEPASVEFCHRIGLDYVSCSPYRVPIARLAAAQAKIRETK